MFVILMTTLFYKALILHGEIWCWSLLGLKGLTPSSLFELIKTNFCQLKRIHTYKEKQNKTKVRCWQDFQPLKCLTLWGKKPPKNGRKKIKDVYKGRWNGERNRPFARWRRFSTKTRNHFVFSFIFKFVIPLRFKITKALICKRKQNPEGFWLSKMTSSCKWPIRLRYIYGGK